jgi:hypothetical protein
LPSSSSDAAGGGAGSARGSAVDYQGEGGERPRKGKGKMNFLSGNLKWSSSSIKAFFNSKNAFESSKKFGTKTFDVNNYGFY